VFKLLAIIIWSLIFLVADLYIYQGINSVIQKNRFWRFARGIFWGLTVFSILGLFFYNFWHWEGVFNMPRRIILVIIIITYFSKFFTLLFLFFDDVRRLFVNLVRYIKPQRVYNGTDSSKFISRSQFLVKAGIIAGVTPFIIMGAGMISGAYDYRIRRKTIKLPNLPGEFDGIRILQVSDIHAGSFFNKKAVSGGIDLILNENPDLIFFTGDLVNNETTEVNEYFDLFKKIKAPKGVYSILGNHDYGDYKRWSSQKAKARNLSDMIDVHKKLGWDILLNENRTLKEGGSKISIIGVENWGAGRFQKYGNLQQASAGTEESSTKLLLSHDPSHWDAQVRKDNPDIDIMLAGHTHGFQFGVEIGDFKWSPAQYAYKQWAGLYKEAEQYLYVNRGFGFIGYPGRIGILPEITVIELKKLSA